MNMDNNKKTVAIDEEVQTLDDLKTTTPRKPFGEVTKDAEVVEFDDEAFYETEEVE